MIQKSKVKKIIRDQGLRISPDSFDGINREVIKLILKMCERVEEDNMKTLQPKHTKIRSVQSIKTDRGMVKNKTLSKDETMELMRRPFKTTAEVIAEAREKMGEK